MIKKAMLKTIREAFEEDRGHTLKLTDDAISAIVERIGEKEFVEMDGEEQFKLFETAENAFKGIAIADPSITGIVSKFDKEFDAELGACIESVIKSKTSSVDIYGQFKRLFSREELNEIPYPGSDADDVKGTNYKPDIVEKKAVSGGKIRVVFTDDLVNATPRGKAYQADIDDAGNELKISGSVARLKNAGKQKLRSMIDSATQGRNAMRSMFRRSLQLHHKLDAIDGMPLVQWSWIPGADDKCPVVPKEFKGSAVQKISRSPKPFWFVPVIDGKPDHANGKAFSVSQVIAFNPSKALAMPDHGTLADLVDSAKGEPETPETIGEKMSVEEMDTTIVVLNAKLANTQERAALRTRAVQPDNDEVRASYCALFVNLRGFYNANEKWYEEYLGKQENETIKERDAKKATAA